MSTTIATESASISNNMFASEDVLQLWDGRIRTIKRLLNKCPNNDVNKILALDIIEAKDTLISN